MREAAEYPEQPASADALDAFQNEMWELKVEEESGAVASAHFQELDPGALTLDDRAIWKKLQAHELTLEEFNAYQGPIFRGDDTSRKNFAAFIGNKLMVQQHENEREEK